MLRGKLITLFGGSGFIGRYVAQALLLEGARLRVAQRDPRQAWFLKSLGQLGGTQAVAADVTRPDTVRRAVRDSDAVVNLVGILSGNFQAVHVDGARAVAEACAAEGVTGLVHLSAIGADPQAASNYGRTKGEGEAAARAACPEVTILRPSVVFGREDQFVNRFARLIAIASNVPLIKVVPVLAPKARFQPVFVGDVADAVARALGDVRTHGGRTYELGGPDVISMMELNRYIADETGRKVHFMEVPDSIGAAIAKAGFLPGAPITRDQWLMLQRDNVVPPGAPGLETLGVTPTPLAAVAPSYLVQYRRSGRFGRKPSSGWAA